MGALQIIFADNPRPGSSSKKDLQSQDKTSKVKRKVGSRMKPSPKQLRARKKFAAMARARGKVARAKKRAIKAKANPRKKRRNPVIVTAQKGKRKIRAGMYLNKKDHLVLQKRIHAYDTVAARGNIRKRSKAARRIKKAAKGVARLLKASGGQRRKVLSRAVALKKKGYKIKKVYISPKSDLASAAKAVGKRKKRKGGKRKHSRKGSQVAKRRKKRKSAGKRKSKRTRARKSGRRKSARRRSGKRKARTIVLKRKGSGVYIRRNPDLKAKFEQYSGFKIEEAGSLLVGGAIYGTVDGLAAKYAPSIYAMAAKVPVVGTTVVPALIGAALNYAGQHFKVKALSLVGEGLVGAAFVAMGIQASAYLPGVAPAAHTAGVDFTPGRGVLMGGYPRDGADFGNVDFTPGPGVLMGAQAQLGMDAQMGEVPAGLSGYARDGADFGLVPEGLGGLN